MCHSRSGSALTTRSCGGCTFAKGTPARRTLPSGRSCCRASNSRSASNRPRIDRTPRPADPLMSSTSRRMFWLMLLGVLVAASDLTVVTTVLPQIIFDLGISLRSELPQAAWIVNAYLIAYTLVIPLLGRVSDRRGRLTVFLWCLALFSLGSL